MPKPIIDQEKCQVCGACVDACPQECFEKKGDKVEVAKPDECIGCQACVGACPHEAISIED